MQSAWVLDLAALLGPATGLVVPALRRNTSTKAGAVRSVSFRTARALVISTNPTMNQQNVRLSPALHGRNASFL